MKNNVTTMDKSADTILSERATHRKNPYHSYVYEQVKLTYDDKSQDNGYLWGW